MKKFKLWGNLGLTVFFIIAYIVNPSNLNPLYAQGAFSLLFMVSAYVVVNSTAALAGIKIDKDELGQVKINVDKKTKGLKGLVITLACLWGVYMLVNFISIPLFNFWAYRDQLGDMEVTEFSDDVQLMDLSQVPIVDQDLAKTLADKKLGEDAGIGSQVFVGEPVMQQVDGKLVWVVPLQHSGFFKWLNNLSGSAGYIIVSATDQTDITLVESAIKYQPSSYFFDDIDRYLRVVKGYVFSGITDYSFEIDDDGTPYWIITTYKNTWLFDLPEATGVIILNATTGQTSQYTIDTVPDWVDRVQPEDFIIDQINNQGIYVHGVFNFSNKDKFMTSNESAIIYNDGNCYLFTGLTSVGADESAIGFVMVDMVTKEVKIYQISGATETAAMNSAEGSVQQYGYTATSPIIINHQGIPSYFITLKDNSGLIKQYAFVSVADVTTVGVGESISSAISNYEKSLSESNSFVVDTEETGELETYTGQIVRIASESLDSSLYYKFIIEGKEDKIFIASSSLSDELALSLEGDGVQITYYSTDDGVINVVSFDNKEFTQ
ncbi:MAG: hypothetical protein R3Y35_05730 [Clostridia bacterium]